MTSRRLVNIVTFLLLLAMLIPLGLSIWLAHRQAQKTVIQEVDDYANWVVIRTQKVVQQAKLALNDIDQFTGTPCSPEHLMAMRRVAFSNHYVQELIYVNDRQPLCSSLENNSREGRLPSPERATVDGYQAWLTSQNDIGIKRIMVALGSEHHVVMLDPLSFIDVLTFGASPIKASLVSMTTNRLIASSGGFNPAVWQQAQQSTLTHFQQKGTLYDVRRFPELGLAIITAASLAPLQKNLHRQLLIWLPIGVLMSLVIAYLLLRVLRRMQSPHARMRDAIKARDIVVYYQPIIALDSGKVVGAEALARWPQADGRFLTPDIFIPLAEQSGLMPQLTQLRRARHLY